MRLAGAYDSSDNDPAVETRTVDDPLPYGWFTEGFDLPDLKEAKAFLEELGGTLQ
jgi:hypothetical protein